MSVVVDKTTGEIIDRAAIYSEETVSKPSGASRSREDSDFVKMYRRFIQQIADLSMESPTALRVLLFLIRHMDGMNAIGVPQKLIAEMIGVSRQTVNTAITYLADHGWIEVYKLGKANIYVVNPDVVWTSYADQKQYCKFQATMLLSGEDNWDVRRADRSQIKYLDPLAAKEMAEREYPNPASRRRTLRRVPETDQVPGQMTIEDFPEVMPGG